MQQRTFTFKDVSMPVSVLMKQAPCKERKELLFSDTESREPPLCDFVVIGQHWY